MSEDQYRRLTWARRRQAGFVVFSHTRSSLWLGKDHVLAIDSSGYTETYKRFYFQDIQAITIRHTNRRKVWNWVLALPLVIFLAIWVSAVISSGGASMGGIIAGTIFALLWGVPLLINNLRGPTCACQLRTAVQVEDLPSLCRLRKTRRILDRLRPLIAQAQGQLASEEIAARMQAWSATGGTGESGVRPSPGAENSALSETLEGLESSPSGNLAAPGDGRTPTVRYVVDDPNLPPRILS
jgi:hypothetical protein